MRSNRLGGGGPDVIIGGDGNCLFRCLSYVLTGSQDHEGETVKAGLWTVDWTMEWTLDWMGPRC